MDVVDDARAGDLTEVPAEVVALWSVRFGERAHALSSQAVDLHELIVVELRELGHVAKWRHHHVARGVRVFVQEAEGRCAAPDDEPVLVGGCSRVAEDASGLLVGAHDVLEAPRRPQLLRHAPEATTYSADGARRRR